MTCEVLEYEELPLRSRARLCLILEQTELKQIHNDLFTSARSQAKGDLTTNGRKNKGLNLESVEYTATTACLPRQIIPEVSQASKSRLQASKVTEACEVKSRMPLLLLGCLNVVPE